MVHADRSMIFINWKKQTTLGIKYYHVISAVDTKILTQVVDIMQIPPDSNKCITQKSRFIDFFSNNEENNLRKLVSKI